MGLKGHRLDFIGVQNAHMFITLPPLCFSSNLARMEGGSDQLAGSKRSKQVASNTRYFPLKNAWRVTPSGRLPSSCDRPVGSKADGKPAVLKARLLHHLRHDDGGNGQHYGDSSVDADQVCLFVCHIGIDEFDRRGALTEYYCDADCFVVKKGSCWWFGGCVKTSAAREVEADSMHAQRCWSELARRASRFDLISVVSHWDWIEGMFGTGKGVLPQCALLASSWRYLFAESMRWNKIFWDGSWGKVGR